MSKYLVWGMPMKREGEKLKIQVLPNTEATPVNPKPECKWQILESFRGATLYSCSKSDSDILVQERGE